MEVFSPYLLASVVSWIVAQGSKYIYFSIKNRNFDHFRQLYLSGNMPSAHSAMVVSVATTIGLYEGFDSAIFGLAVVIAGIVMYDAVMVRRSVGEQGLALQTMISLVKKDIAMPRAAKGHTPLEVVVGAAVGVVVGYVVFIATK